MSEEQSHTEEATTTDNGEPDILEVDFGEVKIPLPKDHAKALIAERDKRQAAHREVLARLEAKERSEAEAARKAKEAEDRAKAAELAKKGNLEEAEKVWKAETEKAHAALIAQIKNRDLDLALAKRQDLLDGTAGVVRDYIERRTMYDPTVGAVVAVAEDGSPATDSEGKPLSVDAFIGQFLADNPAFAKAATPAATGGRASQSAVAPRRITRAEYDSNPQKYGALLASNQVTMKE